MDSIIIIPTLDPNNNLIKLVNELKRLNLNKILIVDDGSDSKCAEIFEKLEELNCKVLHHESNLGKGQALRDGIKYASENYKNILGYITADSDYQHLPKDILSIAIALKQNSENIVLGERDFKSINVPTRSKFGNKFSSIFFKMQTGIKLEDTQTGLRGIPIKYTSLALTTLGNRYDYEMNFLTSAALAGIKFTIVDITTVYEGKNESSHFRTIADAVLIYKELIKFAINSILSACIDVGLFTLIVKVLPIEEQIEAVIATVIARLISGVFNFTINSKIAFNSKEKINKQAYKYFTLFIVQMLVSSLIVSALSILPINITVIKILVDMAIFIVNYFIQKRFIFK